MHECNDCLAMVVTLKAQPITTQRACDVSFKGGAFRIVKQMERAEITVHSHSDV